MRALLPAAAALLLLSGCGIIYRSNVYQGNLLEEKSIAQLQPGLSKRQVIVLLGSPAVEDPFHQARWDYVASIRRGRGDTEVRNLTLHFEGDSLVRWEGEHFPEQDLALMQELRPYGNLPKDKDKEQGRGGR